MNSLTPRVAVYTGSFDPVTLGHLSVIERSSRLFDRVVVGVGINVEKQALFSPEERVELVTQATAPLGNVEVRSFEGLAVEFVGRADRSSWCGVSGHSRISPQSSP